MKKILACLLVGMAFTSNALAEPPFSKLTFPKACKQAEQEHKLVMVDFFTTWCGPCKMLDKDTWKDEKVRAWLDDQVIPIKVDAEKNRKLSGKYEVEAYPTILFVKPDGTEVTRLVGYRKPEKFLSEVRGIVKDAEVKKKKAGSTKQDPMKKMKSADSLAEKGENEKALEAYLWCFDNGQKTQAFSSARTTILLARIVELGKDYPPAIEALRERRNKLEEKLLALKDDDKEPDKSKIQQLSTDYAALNRELGEKDHTLRLYDELKKSQASTEFNKSVLPEIIDQLIKKKRYQDILDGVGDPIKQFDEDKAAADKMKENIKALEDALNKEDTKVLITAEGDEDRNTLIILPCKYFEALLGVGENEKAMTLADRVLSYDKTAKTFERLIKRAKRAKQQKAIDELIKRAENQLSTNEVEKLARFRLNQNESRFPCF